MQCNLLRPLSFFASLPSVEPLHLFASFHCCIHIHFHSSSISIATIFCAFGLYCHLVFNTMKKKQRSFFKDTYLAYKYFSLHKCRQSMATQTQKKAWISSYSGVISSLAHQDAYEKAGSDSIYSHTINLKYNSGTHSLLIKGPVYVIL